MIYLSNVGLPAQKPDRWPYNVEVLKDLEGISFDTPVTFIAGENGTGKSTIMESMAIKLKMPSIGRADAEYDETLKELREFAKSMSISMKARPNNKFFLRSEDFFNFVIKINAEKGNMLSELNRVEEEYRDKSQFTKNQARAAYKNSYHQMKRLYGDDMLTAASHGESFIRLFNNRIRPNGLYFLDEPTVPLSPLRQLTLLHIIKEMAEENNCQFIVATHSPMLLAYEKATIYSLDNGSLEKVHWQDLESVQLLKDFLNEPQRYINRL